MAYIEKTEPLWEMLASVAADEGLCLYDAERLTPASLRISLARISVVPRIQSVELETDSEDLGSSVSSSHATNTRVTSGDCSRICKRLMVIFAAEVNRWGVVAEPELDVSSAGINRILRLPDHYVGAIGERVKLTLRSQADQTGCVLFGILKNASFERILVEDENSGEEREILLNDIKKASVDFKF